MGHDGLGAVLDMRLSLLHGAGQRQGAVHLYRVLYLPKEKAMNARERRLEARREARRHTFAPTAVPAGVKAAKRAQPAAIGTGGVFRLPLRVKPNGQWGYKFGSMRRAMKSGRLTAPSCATHFADGEPHSPLCA